MAVRITITTLFIFGMLCAMLAPLRQSAPWVAEYALVAVTPSLPVQTSENEPRDRTSQSPAAVQALRQRRVPRVAVSVDVPPPRPPRPRPEQFSLPPAPLRTLSDPRAPPVVC